VRRTEVSEVGEMHSFGSSVGGIRKSYFGKEEDFFDEHDQLIVESGRQRIRIFGNIVMKGSVNKVSLAEC